MGDVVCWDIQTNDESAEMIVQEVTAAPSEVTAAGLKWGWL